MRTFRNAIIITLLILLALIVVGTIKWQSMEGPRDAIGEGRQINGKNATLTYSVAGKGQTIIMLPSLGRPASDFNELAQTLIQNGYRVILVEPRGMKDQTGTQNESVTLFNLADDVAEIAAEETAADEKIVIAGHAFGNRVARAFAQSYQDKTKAVMLFAAGGKVPLHPRTRAALVRTFYFFLPNFIRLREMRHAFFAGDNPIPDYWIGGWNIPTSQVQRAAVDNTPPPLWWQGGEAPMLVLQPMQDAIAPYGNAQALKKEFAARVEVVKIENAGHALLPEQPDHIARAVVDFLARLP